MAYKIKKDNTTRTLNFVMISSTDHVSPVTGATVTVKLSKNGGAFGDPAGAVSELTLGVYKVAAASGDASTLGPLWLHATATGCDPTDTVYEVVAYDPDSATSLGLTNLDATVASRLATSGYTAPPATGDIATAVWAETARTLSSGGVQAIWDAATSALSTASSIGKLLVDNINAAISTRLATSGYTAPVTSGITLNTSEHTSIADAILKRDWTSVTGEAARSVLNALRFLRNKVDLATTPGTMDVKKEDDSTSAWTAALTTNAAAEPVTIIDPA